MHPTPSVDLWFRSCDIKFLLSPEQHRELDIRGGGGGGGCVGDWEGRIPDVRIE